MENEVISLIQISEALNRQSGSERNAHCSRKAGRELGGGVVSGEVPDTLHSVSISNDLYRSGRAVTSRVRCSFLA